MNDEERGEIEAGLKVLVQGVTRRRKGPAGVAMTQAETAAMLDRRLAKIGDELARLNRTLEGIAALMANQQAEKERGEG